MSHTQSAPPPSVLKAIGLAIAAAAVVCIVLLAFAWPSITSKPHDIPVGIVASADQQRLITEQLDNESDGAIALESFEDRDAAIAAIQQRHVYGAVVFDEGTGNTATPPEVLIATAANPVVAQLLQGVATNMQEQLTAQVNQGIEQQVQQLIAGSQAGQIAPTQLPDSFTIPDAQVTVTDIVPFADSDPRGAGLSAAALPLVMGGMIGAILISVTLQSTRLRLVALGVYTVVAGLALSGILGGWFGAIHNNYWLNALAITLSIAAISATIIGLRSVIGFAGLGIGAALMFIFANPISGSALPPEFLVGFWGQIGQLFPPGAGQTLIRTLSYFPDASTTFPWLVLTGWTAFGLALIFLSTLKKDSSAPAVSENAKQV